jgi:3-oxoacyl-[acyl-carrier-protein] synthase II
VGLIFFVLLGAASVSTDDPLTSCRPFDRKRSGLVMGEGSGFVVLEEEGHANRRGAKIYAEVAGYGSSMDAYQVTAPHPMGIGAEQAMRFALRDAGILPEGIDYINAHGTSTKLNDTAETLAIKNVFQSHAKSLAVSSSKSMTGHLLSASGGPEFVYTVLSVYHDAIHPTINITHPDPKCDLDYVAGGWREKTVRAALSNSFGFGGQNASIIVKKYLPVKGEMRK